MHHVSHQNVPGQLYTHRCVQVPLTSMEIGVILSSLGFDAADRGMSTHVINSQLDVRWTPERTDFKRLTMEGSACIAFILHLLFWIYTPRQEIPRRQFPTPGNWIPVSLANRSHEKYWRCSTFSNGAWSSGVAQTFTYLTSAVYKTCLSEFESHMHEAQVRRGRMGEGLIYIVQLPHRFETVCKQFINGSVPFGYSLNSGFDTGNDSWLSSGAWQVGTPDRKKNACRCTGAVWAGERGREKGDPQTSGFQLS